MKPRHVVVGAVAALALTIGGVALAGDDGQPQPIAQVNDSPGDGPTGASTGSDSFVGLSVEDAVARAEDEGRPWRIARQDDERFALTDNLVAGRVTFEVDAGTITSSVIEQPNTDSPTDAIVEDPARADLIAAAVKRLLTLDNGFGGADVFDDIRVASVIGNDPGSPLQGLDLELIAATLSEIGTVHFIDGTDAEIEALFAIFGLLGPNGAGKTTIIGALLGLIHPDAGRVRLFGNEIQGSFDDAVRRIGAIMETPAFYPYLSGRDNLRYFQGFPALRTRTRSSVCSKS